MSSRRILSVWFPRLGAERLLRRLGDIGGASFAVVEHSGTMQVLSSLSGAAEAAGLRPGQPLRDAHAICAGLLTRPRNAPAEAALLQALGRWAGQFSPWVSVRAPDALMLDITGCAHLFGDEAALMDRLEQGAGDLGMTARCGLADTPGAAWALARHAGQGAVRQPAGDAIDQEARATRSRAARRPAWMRGDAAGPGNRAETADRAAKMRIAAPGQTRSALAPLPVAALRLPPDTVAHLSRLGLRRIGDLAGQPRGPLARRFGRDLLLRLDQALGAVPEPVSPAAAPPRFATRLTLPDPIGLRDDLQAGLDRLVPRLCALLQEQGQGARRLCLQAFRCDGTVQALHLGLARPADRPERMRPLLETKLEEVDPGFGIDVLRLEATRTEPLPVRQAAGHVEATRDARARQAGETALQDLIGRVGARIGLEAITRRHPASSHIPEKCAQVLAAAWSAPHDGAWPGPPVPRPLLIWRPEPVAAPDHPRLAAPFRWRGQTHDPVSTTGPERIAPEWWLDDPAWRSGVRDYWRVVTARGDLLWLFYAHGGALSSGWFCHGRFA